MSLTPEEVERNRACMNAIVKRFSIGRIVSISILLIPVFEMAYLYLRSS